MMDIVGPEFVVRDDEVRLVVRELRRRFRRREHAVREQDVPTAEHVDRPERVRVPAVASAATVRDVAALVALALVDEALDELNGKIASAFESIKTLVEA